MRVLVVVGLLAALAGSNSAAAGTEPAGDPTTEPPLDDGDGEFSRETFEDDRVEDGEVGSSEPDSEGDGGSGVVAPVRVACSWFAPAASQEAADTLNSATTHDSAVGVGSSGAAIDVEYYVDNGTLRRWNPLRNRFERYELADCSRARNEPAVTTGDVRWNVVVPPSPAVLIPALRLVVTGRIRPPESQISPADAAPVNLGLWFAVTDNGPIVAEGQLGPLWARGTATLTTTSFDPGNGQRPISCDGGGVAISSLDTVEQGPCGYTYRTIDDVNNDRLTITIDSAWTIVWETSDANASADPPETMTRTTVIPYDVYEIQTVGTNGK